MSQRSTLPGFAIAADIGGTNMRAALVTRDGKVSHRNVCPTNPDAGIEDGSARLAALISTALDAAGIPTVVGLGIATAGPLDPATGVYNHPPNLQAWHGKTMKPLLERDLRMPVWIGHDATLAAFAETQAGPHKGARDLIYVTISTGIGGGIIANGEMVTGSTGGAGEMGHFAVRPGAQRCNVGCDGCFEGNACGPAIVKMAAARIAAGGRSRLTEMAGGNPSRITPRLVMEAAAAGDGLAGSVVDTVIDNIGIGLAGLLNIFDPEALVIGGGVVEGLRPQFERVRASVMSHALPRYRDAGGVPVSITTLGDDVSLLGAAFLAFRKTGAGEGGQR